MMARLLLPARLLLSGVPRNKRKKSIKELDADTDWFYKERQEITNMSDKQKNEMNLSLNSSFVSLVSPVSTLAMDYPHAAETLRKAFAEPILCSCCAAPQREWLGA